MATQYSVQFFTSLVEQLQEVCRNHLHYNQFVEVSGYVSVEIDNIRKERYVLSELLQSSGNVVSESYCTKAFKTTANLRTSQNQVKSVVREQAPVMRNTRTEIRKYQDVPFYASSSSKRKFIDVSEHDDRHFNKTIISTPKRSISTENQPYPTLSVFRRQSDTSGQNSSFTIIPQFKQSSVAESRDTVAHGSSETSHAQLSSPTGGSNKLDMSQTESTPEEEVIDLDMVDDDLEMSGSVDEEASVSGSNVLSPEFQSLPDPFSRKSNLSPGTLVAIKNAVKKFQRFVSEKNGEELDLLSTSPEDLNEMLLMYFRESRKKDGRELAGVSMKNILAYLELFLKESGYPYLINKGQAFKSVREYIKTKMDETVKQFPQVMSPVTDEDIEILFHTNQLGSQNPDILANTVWFLNSKYLNIRRPAEHFGLKWGDIALKVDDDGSEYIERPLNQSFSVKVFANYSNPDRCFINFYKQFKAHRPKMCLDESSPFYLKPNKYPGEGDYWMSEEPMSWSMLNSLWKKMVAAAKLPLNKRIVL